MSEILKGAVGLAVKGGPKVKNDKEDILLVRRILRANKYNVAESGGIDPGLLKALSAAAKKAGMEPAVGVIVPNGELMKSLKPKYEKAKKNGDAGGPTKKIDTKVVKHGSKELVFLPEDYDTAVEKLFKSLDGYANQLVRAHNINRKILIQYNHAWSANNGFLESVSTVVSIKAGRVKPIDKALSDKAAAAVLDLAKTMGKRDIKNLKAHMEKAEAAVNASSRDVDRFLKDFTGSAGGVATALSVTSATGFAIVGGMAAPALVAATTLSLAQATVVSASSVAVVASLSNDLGKVTAKQKVTFYEAINNATIDGLVAAATAGLANKVPLKWCQGLSEKMAPKLARTLFGVSGKEAVPFLTRFMTGAGEEGCKAAIGQTITEFGKYVKSGGTKSPTKKDFDAAVQQVLLSGVTGGLMKDLDAFNKKWTKEATKDIEGKLVPEMMKKMTKGNKLTPAQSAEIAKEMSNKFSEEVIKNGIKGYLSVGTGKESPKTMTDIARKSALESPAIRKKMEAALKEEIAKRQKT